MQFSFMQTIIYLLEFLFSFCVFSPYLLVKCLILILCYKIDLPSRMPMRIAAIIFLFLIRLLFPKSKPLSKIICRRRDQSILKRAQKFDKLDYRLNKTDMDLESLLLSKNSNAILIVLNFCIDSGSFYVSLTYKQCQLKLL